MPLEERMYKGIPVQYTVLLQQGPDGPEPYEGSGGGGGIADGSITTEKFAPDAKSPLASEADEVPWSGITGKPAVIAAGADVAAARAAINAGTSNVTVGTGADNAKAGNWEPAAADISDASVVGRGVLTAADAAAARTAIGAGTSSQTLSALSAAAATTGTATTLSGITALVLAGAINERTKGKAEVIALTPIADPSAADAEEVAILLNAVIAALKA